MINNIGKKLKKLNVKSCIVLREGDVILHYSKNEQVVHSLQKINSCTKSIISALLGICIDRGLIPNVDIPISEYFLEYSELFIGDKNRITIRHLLTMSIGSDWPEFGEWDCFAPMVFQKDIIRFILERELVEIPGQLMNYNSGCSHLLSYIIQSVVGTTLESFASEVLFRPLGIKEYKWYELQGVNLGADGLRLSPNDMIKVGQLYLNNGVYNNKRILSESWIKESLDPRYKTYENIGSYCYHWWKSEFITDDGTEVAFNFALGYGGQFIILVPTLSIVVGIISNSYEDSLAPLRFFKSTVLPGFYSNRDQS